ncbi:MAG: DcaP family trimeric outer membrane transporter [Gammaproteobacteria bacterium]
MNAPRAARRGVLVALTALAATVSPAHAQEDGDELATLRAEVARLAARVAELEARLAATSSRPDAAAPTVAAAEPAPSPDTPAASTTATAQTRALAATAPASPAPTALPAGRTPDGSPPPGPRVSVGGRVKLDVVFNDRSRGSGSVGDTLLSPGAIALDGAGEDDQLDFSARASRLWVKAWQATPYGDAGAYLELDLLGDGGDARISNGYGVRLRHAYGELGGLLFGQTYSTFVNVGALPELNDDGITAGGLNVRQPLLRYTQPLGGGALQFALESPESTITARDGRRLTPDDDRLPDIVLRYQREGRFGQWSLATMARELRIDQGAGGARDAVLGAAASLAGEWRLGLADGLRFTAVGGNAVGRYLSFNAFDGARLTARGTLRATPMAGGSVSWQHLWSSHWRSNLTAGYAWADDHEAPANVNVELYTVHANLLWSPLASTTLGVEWIHAWRRQVDGHGARLNRLQFSAVHKF